MEERIQTAVHDYLAQAGASDVSFVVERPSEAAHGDYATNAALAAAKALGKNPRGGMILTRDDESLAKKIDKAVFPGLQGGPHMHQIAAKVVSFKEALHPAFAAYAAQIIANTKAMEGVFKEHGARMITGGSDNHLILLDALTSGGEAEALLDRAGITLNKNAIADDMRKPMDPSGIRFGTPAMTTRGFLEAESAEVANLMLEVLTKRDDATVEEAKMEVKKLALSHPIPESFL